jgi:hypothetical protein
MPLRLVARSEIPGSRISIGLSSGAVADLAARGAWQDPAGESWAAASGESLFQQPPAESTKVKSEGDGTGSARLVAQRSPALRRHQMSAMSHAAASSVITMMIVRP